MSVWKVYRNGTATPYRVKADSLIIADGAYQFIRSSLGVVYAFSVREYYIQREV